MQETGNNTSTALPRITLRIGTGTLSFAVASPTAKEGVAYEPYTAKSGISMAANLREAFKTSPLLSQGHARAQVLLDTDVLVVPIEEFEAEKADPLFRHTFTGNANSTVLHSVIPDVDAVALFAINRDLKLVIDDHFGDVRFIHVCQPLWNLFYHRSLTGTTRKLYGYFHDGKLSVCSFDKNRFRFCNTYDVAHSRDAVFYLLYVWKQLGLDSTQDELCIAGCQTTEHDWMLPTLKRYLRKVYLINPSAEFNRAPVTHIRGMALDMATIYVKGR